MNTVPLDYYPADGATYELPAEFTAPYAGGVRDPYARGGPVTRQHHFSEFNHYTQGELPEVRAYRDFYDDQRVSDRADLAGRALLGENALIQEGRNRHLQRPQDQLTYRAYSEAPTVPRAWTMHPNEEHVTQRSLGPWQDAWDAGVVGIYPGHPRVRGQRDPFGAEDRGLVGQEAAAYRSNGPWLDTPASNGRQGVYTDRTAWTVLGVEAQKPSFF